MAPVNCPGLPASGGIDSQRTHGEVTARAEPGMTRLFPAIVNAWTLHRSWPRAEFVIVDDAGHGAEAITRELIDAAGRFLDSCRR